MSAAPAYDRGYAPLHGTVAHYLMPDRGSILSLCDMWVMGGFYGTGSQEEYEKAAALRLCKNCARKAGES